MEGGGGEGDPDDKLQKGHMLKSKKLRGNPDSKADVLTNTPRVAPKEKDWAYTG